MRSAIVWLVLGWCVAGWLIVGPRAPDQPLESGCTSEQRASDPSCEDAAPRALLGMALRVATWPVAYLTE